jgi:hypothetical protein
MRTFTVGLAVTVAALVAISASVAAPPEIPTVGELAFCDGQPVEPVNGVLTLDSACVLNLQIGWIHGMKSAFVDFSADGGATWQKDPVPLEFPVVAVGLTSGVTFPACDGGLPSGTYLLRAHGFRSPVGQASVFSDPFPHSVRLNCGA